MRINSAGLAIIKNNEGCKLTAYRDVVDVPTIGWGHTGPEVHDGMTITQAQADEWLAKRLADEFEVGVTRALMGAPATDNQFSAMVSLAYNIGVGAFKNSSVAREHRAGNYTAAADAFLLWNKAGGQMLAGLDRRRREERALYLADSLQPATPEPPPGADAVPLVLTTAHDKQAALKALGFYRGALDGIWGDRSRQAFIDFIASRH